MNVNEVMIEGIEDIKLPKLGKIKQINKQDKLENVREELSRQINNRNLLNKISSGDKIAIGVGSRGIDQIKEVVKEVVYCIKEKDAIPFIVPAMGSHGGANAKGQKEILEGYGITEKEIGVPIKSSMEVNKITFTSEQIPVYFDRVSYEADGIVLINRVKVHTDFSGEVESGLMKMLSIGFGKHKGATTLHRQGREKFSNLIPEVAQKIIEEVPVIMGVALVENARDNLYKVEAVSSNQMMETDKKLLSLQKDLMPRIPFDYLDILIVDKMGKDISGTGMDTNIVGRIKEINTEINLILVRDLTSATHGNATGIGLADLTTKKLFDKIDFNATYTNVLTSTIIKNGKLPIVLPNDKIAIKAAQLLSNKDYANINIVNIKNTLDIMEMKVSQNLYNKSKTKENLITMKEPSDLNFDSKGNLLS